MSKKVVQFNRIGSVTFSKNRRSKSIKISVKPNKSVLVSFPFFVSSKDAMAFVIKNEEWIAQQQNKFDARKSTYGAGSVIETRLHKIIFLEGALKKAESKENVVEITIDDFKSSSSALFIEQILTEIYRFEAKKLLPVRLNEISRQYGFQYRKVTIRNNRRNWGSCSSKNNISLNLQMMKLPDELIDYILLHELVHTEIKNHSADFWTRMNELTGFRAKELAQQVKQYSTFL